jgi:superfamily II DNA/RNA helicase
MGRVKRRDRETVFEEKFYIIDTGIERRLDLVRKIHFTTSSAVQPNTDSQRIAILSIVGVCNTGTGKQRSHPLPVFEGLRH